MITSLFLWKCVSLPLVVVLISWVQKRWGNRIGGMITGLPTTAAFISIFLAIEQGPVYAQDSAGGTLAGLFASALFARAFLHVAKKHAWPLCISAAVFVFLAAIGLFHFLYLSFTICVLLGVLAVALIKTIPQSDNLAKTIRPPRWSLAIRAVAALALLLAVTALAYILPPEFSGMLASYPIVYSTVFCFTLAHEGRAAIVQFMHGAALGLFGFIAFFIVVHVWPFGSIASVFSLAFLAAVIVAGLAQTAGHILEKRIRRR